MMRHSIHGILLASALLALPVASAQAITCFVVYDRNDNAIYQDSRPPIDLSERGAAERQALYRRGEHLIVMESDRCPVIVFFTGAAGSSALSVDEIVGGVPARGPAGTAATPQSRSASGASSKGSRGY